MERRAIAIRGTVQGVGFRPFVYNLASSLNLGGFVRNQTDGVRIEVEGEAGSLDQFLARLLSQAPPLARIEAWDSQPRAACGERQFRIETSDRGPANSPGEVAITPDAATCDRCLAELFAPRDRRYRYPFINCTNCGPRLTIVRSAPYDRERTTMARFVMCRRCRTEYEDPADRRFHAQPNACPACGPKLAALDGGGQAVETDDPLAWLVSALRAGKIGAVKGLGGYHLVCDARNPQAVAELRRRKGREEKALAVMVRDAEAAGELCEIDPAALALLTSPRRPIVLMPRKEGGSSHDRAPTALVPPMASDPAAACHPERSEGSLQSPQEEEILRCAQDDGGRASVAEAQPPAQEGEHLRPCDKHWRARQGDRRAYSSLAPGVAPGNPLLGVMLPYTPLHHLLLHDMGGPLVMTSGNRSDEPIAIDEADAVRRLGGIADVFLVHDRPIHVRCDDSVTRAVGGSESPIRRSRGDAPQPVALPAECPTVILAVGGQLKATFALAGGRRAILSHHLGDLDHFEAYRAFERDVALYEQLFALRPAVLAHDLHPDYATTRYAIARAAREGLRLVAVQHHHAHLAAGMAEHGLAGPAVGVCLDGTGYGTDGAIWGGEFLVGGYHEFRRAAHLRYVGMPGGEKAVREGWRMAAAHLDDAGVGCNVWERRRDAIALRTVRRMLERRLNAPDTSSAGRLFDAVASLAGVRDAASFEGQAAMQLEWAAGRVRSDGAYPFEIAGPSAGTPDSFPSPGTPGEGQCEGLGRNAEGGMLNAESGGKPILASSIQHSIFSIQHFPNALTPALSRSTGRGSVGGEPGTSLEGSAPLVIDTRPLIRAVVADVGAGVGPARIARRFHSTWVEIIAAVCRRLRDETGIGGVVFSGGVFMNALLSVEAEGRLSREGFQVYRHHRVPANDGGLSLGQAAVAAAMATRP